MQSNKEERSIQSALGSIPKVNNQRAFSCTVSIAGTGLGDIDVQDIAGAILSQHQLISNENNKIWDQLYVHKVRAYGTAGGYLSIAPYPHRFNIVPGESNASGRFWNSYEGQLGPGTYRNGSLQQMYEFGKSIKVI